MYREIIAVIKLTAAVERHNFCLLVFFTVYSPDPQCITPVYPLLLAQISPRSEAGNTNFTKNHDLPLIPCKYPLAVAALDGRPLGAGQVQHPEVQ